MNEFLCFLCGVKIFKAIYFKKHVIRDHGVFPCEVCVFYCDTQINLNQHLKDEHNSTVESDVPEEDMADVLSVKIDMELVPNEQ